MATPTNGPAPKGASTPAAETKAPATETGSNVTPEEQKLIDEAMGNEPSEEALADETPAPSAPGLVEKYTAFSADYGSVNSIVAGMAKAFDASVPDDLVIAGVPGFKLRVGHLRAAVIGIRE